MNERSRTLLAYMQAAPLPSNEKERLRRLKDYAILDTLQEASFDRITRIIAETIEVPISLISLIDEDRQWFKSIRGLDASEAPRELAFCSHTILGDQVMVVEDARKDPRFSGNPFVTESPSIRFYAGAPLRTDDGYNLGTLCAIDNRPRQLSDSHRLLLEDLAHLVIDEFELHRHQHDLESALLEAQRANEAKNQFLSSMSHELRTPLNAIIGFAEALELGVWRDDAEKRQQGLRHIIGAGEHLGDLISDVLDLAKIENDAIEISSELFDPCEIFEEIRPLVEQLSGQHQVKLAGINCGDGLVRADRLRFRQILLNMATNAFKYNRSGGTVEFGCREVKKGYLQVYVRDTGIGIPPSDASLVFEPFARLHHQSADVAGSGVGLSITKKLTELMGGTIDFISEFGVGSTFWVEFPLATETKAQNSRASTIPGMARTA